MAARLVSGLDLLLFGQDQDCGSIQFYPGSHFVGVTGLDTNIQRCVLETSQINIMDLTQFLRTDLLQLCKEFGLNINSTAKKAQVIQTIQEADLGEDDVTETLQRLKDDRERDKEDKEHDRELERLRLEAELRRQLGSQSQSVPSTPRTENIDMSRFLQPFKIGQDVGLFW